MLLTTYKQKTSRITEHEAEGGHLILKSYYFSQFLDLNDFKIWNSLAKEMTGSSGGSTMQNHGRYLLMVPLVLFQQD